MAVKKVSARQRMINMMYLVLLALLALNISAEVLPAFANLRIRLQNSAQQARQDGSITLQGLQQAIKNEVEKEKKMTNAGLGDTLQQIQEVTSRLFTSLDTHIDAMSILAEPDEAGGYFLRMDEMEQNFQYWMGSNEEANDMRGNGQAFLLRNQLDEYNRFITQLYNAEVRDTARYLKYNPLQAPDLGTRGQKNKKQWERFTFEGPVIANLATLEALKLDVMSQQNRLLELYQQRFDDQLLVADSVVALSSPVSRVVMAGMPFRTRLAVGLVSSRVTPSFHSSQGSVRLNPGGNSAWLDIPANGALIREGEKEARQPYFATIEVPLTDGTRKRLTVQEEFIVRRPEIVVTSAAVQNLYRSCGNAVYIDVPALGEYYNPVVSASQARVQQSQREQKKFLLVPNGKQCLVRVKSRTHGQLVEIGSLTYRVIEPPRPSLELKVNGRPYRVGQNLPKGSRIQLRVLPDEEFAAGLPEDARYQLETVKVFVKDGIGPSELVKTFTLKGREVSRNSLLLRLPGVVNQARRGSNIYFQISGIFRQNYRNQLVEDKRFSELERTFSFVKE